MSETFETSGRQALGIYNFAGDLGKSTFPPAVTLLLLEVLWREATALVGVVGALGAAALAVLLPRLPVDMGASSSDLKGSGSRARFRLLLLVSVLDTATRMSFLLFLPFLLHAKGGKETAIGFAFAVLFGGGACGRVVCGWLGTCLGFVASVIGSARNLRADRGRAGASPLARACRAAVSRGGAERHVVCAVRHSPGAGADRRRGPWLRSLLHWRDRVGRPGADSLGGDRRLCRANARRDRRRLHGSRDNPSGARHAALRKRSDARCQLGLDFGLSLRQPSIRIASAAGAQVSQCVGSARPISHSTIDGKLRRISARPGSSTYDAASEGVNQQVSLCFCSGHVSSCCSTSNR